MIEFSAAQITHVMPEPVPALGFSDWLATNVTLPDNLMLAEAGESAAKGWPVTITVRVPTLIVVTGATQPAYAVRTVTSYTLLPVAVATSSAPVLAVLLMVTLTVPPAGKHDTCNPAPLNTGSHAVEHCKCCRIPTEHQPSAHNGNIADKR